MKELKINYKAIKLGSFIYLALPVLLFFAFFVKWYVSLLAMITIVIVLQKTSTQKKNKREIVFNIRSLFLISIVLLIWCYLGGQGGLFFQTSDWNERNAIFRDLIYYDWPVFYSKTNTMLTYYIGHWLPAAGLAKIIYIIFGNLDIAFRIGNIILGIWTFLGTVFSYLLISIYVNPKKKEAKWIILAVFIGFSGLDIIGCLLEKWTFTDYINFMHLEWWSGGDLYQFSSNTTVLFWVFNQGVTAWIATLLFLNENSPKYYAFIISCLLISASLPSIGLAILMIGKYVYEMFRNIKNKHAHYFFKETFSIYNLLSMIFIVPSIILYLISNSALGNSKQNLYYISEDHLQLTPVMHIVLAILIILLLGLIITIICKRKYIKTSKGMKFLLGSAILLGILIGLILTHPETRRIYFVFLILECGLYWLCLAPNFYDNILYYLIAFLFMISPMIRIGIGGDFCMRASIPGIIILTSMCAKKICGQYIYKKNRLMSITTLVLTLLLLIGTATPIMEITRGIYKVIDARTFNLQADNIETLNKYHSSGGIYGNFVSENYKNSYFYKYFMR